MQALRKLLNVRTFSILLLLLYTFSFLFRTDRSFDQDLGRHILIGKIIWQTKEIPLTNLFSYTYPDFPFINSHWAFEVLLYLGQQIIGLQAILGLKIIAILFAVWLVLKTVPKNRYLLLPVGFIFLHVLRERPDLRPEILSFLFTGLTIYILDKFERGKSKLIYLLPIVQLLWVNSHIYFILGIFLQAIFLLHISYETLRSHLKGGKLKILGVVFMLSALAGLINPSGLKGFLNPLIYNQNYGYTIAENQNIFLLESINFHDPNFLFVKLAVAIALFSVFIAFFGKKVSLKNLGLIALGGGLALLNIRSFPYLFLISLPAVLENFGGTRFTVLHKILIVITIPLLLYESVFYLNGDYYKYTDRDVKAELQLKESGREALDFVLQNDLPQPIFNNFDIGSYITYRGWPKYKIFVDGRPGEYPAEFFQNDYIPAQENPEKFKELNSKYNFQTIIFSHTDQTPWGRNFLQFVTHNPDWRTVYLDDFMIILAKQDVATNLSEVDWDKIDPRGMNFENSISYSRISLLLLNTNHAPQAKLFAEKALEIFPDSPIGNLLLTQFQPPTNNIFELQKAQAHQSKSTGSVWW